MASYGTLVLIPVPLYSDALDTLSPQVYEYCSNITHFFVENVREARRFLKKCCPKIDIENLIFSETNKNTVLNISLFNQWLKAGITVGVLSDAGCPGIADPGAALVHEAHKLGAKVIPLVGPSSILLSLMASGFNGQSFAFFGYLPIKENERSKQLIHFESLSSQNNQTIIFIETPYRNQTLLQDLIKLLKPSTKLCVCINLTSPNEKVISQPISNWKTLNIKLAKEPAIFLILA